jgi:hypothetical protein
VLETFDPAEVVELTSLANSATELVSATEIPEGSYQELRFVLGNACLEAETAGGSAFYASSLALCPEGTTSAGDLQMPSLGSSGLKVKFDEALEFGGGETTLLVDFDVAESFGKQAGNSGKWVMHPVIKGATMSAAGSVKATLTGACASSDFRAELVAADATAGEKRPFALVEGTLTADYKFALPGDYLVKLVLPATVSAVTPSSPVPVTVVAGQSVPAAFTLTSCTPAP